VVDGAVDVATTHPTRPGRQSSKNDAPILNFNPTVWPD